MMPGSRVLIIVDHCLIVAPSKPLTTLSTKRAQRPWSAVRIAAHVSRTWSVASGVVGMLLRDESFHMFLKSLLSFLRSITKTNDGSSSTRECRIHLGSLGVEEIWPRTKLEIIHSIDNLFCSIKYERLYT